MTKVGFKESRKSIQNYFLWRANRARFAVERVEKIRDLTGLKVLDIGCGYGSLISLLLDKGASVTGTEIERKKLEVAHEFLNTSIFCT